MTGTVATVWPNALDKAKTKVSHEIGPTLPEDGGVSDRLAAGTDAPAVHMRSKKIVVVARSDRMRSRRPARTTDPPASSNGTQSSSATAWYYDRSPVNANV